MFCVFRVEQDIRFCGLDFLPTGHTVQVYTFYCGSVQAWRALPLLKVWPSAYTFSIWLLKVSRLVHTVTESNSRMHAP
jgi:hypothetical protein